MKIMTTGGKGRIGKYLSQRGIQDLGCDVTDELAVKGAIQYYKPDVIIHLAAKSCVDWCEKQENEQKVIDVNFLGTELVARYSEVVGATVILLSTDHIFPGGFWSGKYKEDDTPKPLNFYGTSKIAAEGLTSVYDNMKIVRTSYLFDANRLQFDLIEMMRGIPQEFPTFIRRTFMYLPHFVNSLLQYVDRIDEMPKILHISGSESVSWYEFMLDLANSFGYSENLVIPRKKDLTNGYAPRGKNLGLSTALSMKLGFHKYSYMDGIFSMVKENE